jgi:hypothetical protein
MTKLFLSGVAFAALMFGPALAADYEARPVHRAPRTVYVHPFPMQQRAPVQLAGMPHVDWCWVDNGAWYGGSWRRCSSAQSARLSGHPLGRSSARSSERSPAANARSETARPAASHAGQAVRSVERTAPAPVTAQCTPEPGKKQYWATSLSSTVNTGVLQGLREAVARGEAGWLDVNPEYAIPPVTQGMNLVFYHVGGNCYAGRDCARFPASKPVEGRWGDNEREIDLNDPQVRKIVVSDMVALVRQADERAPAGASVGVHLDNLHRLDAAGLARVFNEYFQAVEAAKQQGVIPQARVVGYVAKNNPEGFKQALDQGLLKTAPLYQINENATLSRDGALDESSRVAQELGRRYNVPVFLMTFGTDIAYTIEQNGKPVDVTVSQDMVRQIAQRPYVSGAAWSPDEAYYHPTLFAQGAPVGRKGCEKVAAAGGPTAGEYASLPEDE